jgi:uncharacterized protein YxeA
MKKIIILLIFLLSIPTTFATLTTKEKLTIQSIFSKYEVNVSKFSKNEQIEKVEKLIQTIDSLLNTSKAENNNLFCDVLLELKNLLRFKHNALTSDITTQYVESP